MNTLTRFAIAAACFLTCAAAVIVTNASSDYTETDCGSASMDGWNLSADYLYAATDASVKLSLDRLESIIRNDPVAKSHGGKMEFGSVKADRAGVTAEVLFLEKDGDPQAFLYTLKHKNDSWYVAGAQRLWFVPRSRLLRGIRV